VSVLPKQAVARRRRSPAGTRRPALDIPRDGWQRDVGDPPAWRTAVAKGEWGGPTMEEGEESGPTAEEGEGAATSSFWGH
jgi:hypothetical protein